MLVDDFEIEDMLGKGGMCTVYRAKQGSLQRTVAVKVLHKHIAQDRESLERLRREAIAISALEHENIIKVFQLGVWQDRPYVALEYLEGISLAQLLKQEGGMPFERALPLLLQICRALDHAHTRGVIHRDLKPSNVMLVGPQRQVKLVDFGIAKLVAAPVDLQRLTLTGDVFGTAAYMSPEQCNGHAVDQRSDIYALGCLIYEVLTGKTPLSAANPIALLHKQIEHKPEFTCRLDRHVLPVIARALEKSPEDRYQSVAALQEDLLTACARSQRAQDWPVLERLAPRRAVVVAASIVAASLAALCLFQPQPAQTSTSSWSGWSLHDYHQHFARAIQFGVDKQWEPARREWNNVVEYGESHSVSHDEHTVSVRQRISAVIELGRANHFCGHDIEALVTYDRAVLMEHLGRDEDFIDLNRRIQEYRALSEQGLRTTVTVTESTERSATAWDVDKSEELFVAARNTSDCQLAIHRWHTFIDYIEAQAASGDDRPVLPKKRASGYVLLGMRYAQSGNQRQAICWFNRASSFERANPRQYFDCPPSTVERLKAQSLAALQAPAGQ